MNILKDGMILEMDGVTVKITNKKPWSRVELFDEDQQLIGTRFYKWPRGADDETRWRFIKADIATDIQNWRN